MSLNRVIDTARAELGYTESPPGSNRVKYWDEYDKAWQGQPWCVTFIWWVCRHAGEASAFLGGGKTASCSILQKWYKAQGQTVPVEEVREGDIVLLNFHGGAEPEHCGLAVGVTRDKTYGWTDDIYTIEGNTTMAKNGAGQDNGGMVCQKVRYAHQIVEVCRPTYAQDPPRPDYQGHWAEDSIRKAIKAGIMRGYEDGSFQPDRAVTRAELATILDRLGVLE